MEYWQELLTRQKTLASAFDREVETELPPEPVLPAGGSSGGSVQACEALPDGAYRESEAAFSAARKRTVMPQTAQAAARRSLEAAQTLPLRLAALRSRQTSGQSAAAAALPDEARTAAVWKFPEAGASAQAALSMAEISRWFERDARRYGG